MFNYNSVNAVGSFFFEGVRIAVRNDNRLMLVSWKGKIPGHLTTYKYGFRVKHLRDSVT